MQYIKTMPWGPLKGRPIRPSRETGHWLVEGRLGWHDCSPDEDRAINALKKDYDKYECPNCRNAFAACCCM